MFWFKSGNHQPLQSILIFSLSVKILRSNPNVMEVKYGCLQTSSREKMMTTISVFKKHFISSFIFTGIFNNITSLLYEDQQYVFHAYMNFLRPRFKYAKCDIRMTSNWNMSRGTRTKNRVSFKVDSDKLGTLCFGFLNFFYKEKNGNSPKHICPESWWWG